MARPIEVSGTPPTSLQIRIARDIVALVRRDVRPPGYHLAEAQLAREIGTSRSPLKAALNWLAILDAIAHSDLLGAAVLMRSHLVGARRIKSPRSQGFDTDRPG